MNPKISVIIPIYNTKDYVKEAVDSIILQKEFICELIIINDGSTDGSGDLVEKLYGAHEFVKIIQTENKGQGHARNLGTDMAKGEYVYYFDSDDISAPNLFRRFYEILSKVPGLELFCFSGESFLDPNSTIENIKEINELSKQTWKRQIEANCNSGEDAFILLRDNNSFSPGPPLYIFKKSILLKNKIKFKHIRYEDEEFTIKLFLYAGRTNVIRDVLFYRRVREGSTMRLKRTFQDIMGYIQTINSLEQLMLINYFKRETKKHLCNKILYLARSIIIVKVIGNIKLSKDEKSIYKKSLKPFILSNKNIRILYYTYSLEYKLRMLKKRIFN